MTTTIYIWKNSPTDVGHVSADVNDTYISFWPANAAKAKNDIKIGQTHTPAFPSSLRIDKRLERRQPDNIIQLHKLNEKIMIDHWNTFKTGKHNRYNMLKSNCSTIIATLLETGSGITPNHTPSIRITDYVNNPYMQWILKLRFFGNYIHMWTPTDVMTYALQLKSKE